MHEGLIELFYIVSQALLTPVMMLLLLAMAWTVLMLGQAVREAVERGLLGRPWRTFVQAVRDGRGHPHAWRQAARTELIRWFARRAGAASLPTLRLLLPDCELRASRHLGRLQMLIRVGPMLGLIGTLIPLGPALQGLSSSNLVGVGENLNVAFTTTVFGIAVGGAAYALYVLHRSWYERDLNDLECIVSLLEESKGDGEENSPLGSRERRRSAGRHGEPV